MGFFVTEENVIRLGAKGLVISGSMYIALGTIYTMRGALNGMGGVVYEYIYMDCDSTHRICEIFCVYKKVSERR